MTFRRAWLDTWPAGIADFALHVLAALWLPGPWWFQWLPDTAMPVLWLRSMITDRMAEEGDGLLDVHRMLHLRHFAVGVLFWWVTALLLGAVLGYNIFVLPLHVAVHCTIDYFTHDRSQWQ